MRRNFGRPYPPTLAMNTLLPIPIPPPVNPLSLSHTHIHITHSNKHVYVFHFCVFHCSLNHSGSKVFTCKSVMKNFLSLNIIHFFFTAKKKKFASIQNGGHYLKNKKKGTKRYSVNQNEISTTADITSTDISPHSFNTRNIFLNYL